MRGGQGRFVTAARKGIAIALIVVKAPETLVQVTPTSKKEPRKGENRNASDRNGRVLRLSVEA